VKLAALGTLAEASDGDDAEMQLPRQEQSDLGSDEAMPGR
jgi:hypothetical protein